MLEKVGKDEFGEASTVEEILAAVAREAGPEHAKMLANMFGIPFQAEADDGVVIDQQPSELARILAKENPADRRTGLSSLYRQHKITLDELIAAGVDAADLEFVAASKGPITRESLRQHGLAQVANVGC